MAAVYSVENFADVDGVRIHSHGIKVTDKCGEPSIFDSRLREVWNPLRGEKRPCTRLESCGIGLHHVLD